MWSEIGPANNKNKLNDNVTRETVKLAIAGETSNSLDSNGSNGCVKCKFENTRKEPNCFLNENAIFMPIRLDVLNWHRTCK
jgi:hypothetical protein